MRGGTRGLVVAAILSAPLPAAAEPPRGVGPAERALVEEALALAASAGERVWPGWNAAPFDLVLVDGEHEYLARSDQRPEGFAPSPARRSAAARFSPGRGRSSRPSSPRSPRSAGRR
ncbi:MAG: hypothetical protein U0599_11135 [Vicinamibacteria bacterium]